MANNRCSSNLHHTNGSVKAKLSICRCFCGCLSCTALRRPPGTPPKTPPTAAAPPPSRKALPDAFGITDGETGSRFRAPPTQDASKKTSSDNTPDEVEISAADAQEHPPSQIKHHIFLITISQMSLLNHLLVITAFGERPCTCGSYMSWACAGGAAETPARFTRAK